MMTIVLLMVAPDLVTDTPHYVKRRHIQNTLLNKAITNDKGSALNDDDVNNKTSLIRTACN